jgi:hypothetical protein
MANTFCSSPSHNGRGECFFAIRKAGEPRSLQKAAIPVEGPIADGNRCERCERSGADLRPL